MRFKLLSSVTVPVAGPYRSPLDPAIGCLGLSVRFYVHYSACGTARLGRAVARGSPRFLMWSLAEGGRHDRETVEGYERKHCRKEDQLNRRQPSVALIWPRRRSAATAAGSARYTAQALQSPFWWRRRRLAAAHIRDKDHFESGCEHRKLVVVVRVSARANPTGWPLIRFTPVIWIATAVPEFSASMRPDRSSPQLRLR